MRRKNEKEIIRGFLGIRQRFLWVLKAALKFIRGIGNLRDEKIEKIHIEFL
jgi:hypothetical protein